MRYYDPEVGRWITPDPLGYADGPNLYAYVHNNPINSFDRLGFATENESASNDDLWKEEIVYGPRLDGLSFIIGECYAWVSKKIKTETFPRSLRIHQDSLRQSVTTTILKIYIPDISLLTSMI